MAYGWNDYDKRKLLNILKAHDIVDERQKK